MLYTPARTEMHTARSSSLRIDAVRSSDGSLSRVRLVQNHKAGSAALHTCASSSASASLGALSACGECCATASSADRRSNSAIATSNTCA